MMSQKKSILVLPFASTAVISGPALCMDGADLLLSMDFDDEGETRTICLRFLQHRAHRFRSECYCTAWHIEEVYDTVCKVSGSKWIKELRVDAVPEWRDYWVMRHFMIYVDSFGCLEVVAESAVLDETIVKNSGGT